MFAEPAIAQALEHLVFARCGHELRVARPHLGFAEVELPGALSTLLLGPLEKGLTGDELVRGDRTAAGGVALMFMGPLEVLLGVQELLLNARALRDSPRELLPGQLLPALANCAHALQAEAKDGLGHPPFIGRPTAFFSRGRGSSARATG